MNDLKEKILFDSSVRNKVDRKKAVACLEVKPPAARGGQSIQAKENQSTA